MSVKTQFLKLKENWLLILVILIILVGLTYNGNGPSTFLSKATNMAVNQLAETASFGADMALSSYRPSYDEDFAPGIEDRQITKTANLSSEVERGDFNTAESQLKNIINSSDSFLLDENVSKNGIGVKEYLTGRYRMKVDVTKYDSVISQLKEIGDVQSFSENSDDITGQYNNLGIELDIERERLNRYWQLFNQSTKIEDKITLNDRIFNQERTIKYYEDRLNKLDNKIEYSTVNLTISEERSNFFEASIVKLSVLAKSFVGSINSLLIIIITIIPYLIVFGLIYYIIKWFRAKKIY